MDETYVVSYYEMVNKMLGRQTSIGLRNTHCEEKEKKRLNNTRRCQLHGESSSRVVKNFDNRSCQANCSFSPLVQLYTLAFSPSHVTVPICVTHFIPSKRTEIPS